MVVGRHGRNSKRESEPARGGLLARGHRCRQARFETLSIGWSDELSRLGENDLDRPLAYPWSEPRALSLALAWVNSELMKNVAEIGCLRHHFEASRGPSQP